MPFTTDYFLSILEIAWINVLLSGDNAVVIAMACRSLPANRRSLGILIGSGAAIALRIVFAFLVTRLLDIPYLQAAGALLLIWIAVSLTRNGSGDHDVKASNGLWGAVATIAIADAAMSLDNVVAIAAIADGDYKLFIIGLILSIPLIVVGANFIAALLERVPLLVWAGAGLLGWVAGRMLYEDSALIKALGITPTTAMGYAAAIAGAALVLAISWAIRKPDAHA
ncbi:TerC family protein [Aestuariivirga sp.]|uniref:TerC family protein n=1 Tax=Aestuariivirga sp. TaxID=2650926 RepID=UPI0039E25EFC